MSRMLVFALAAFLSVPTPAMTLGQIDAFLKTTCGNAVMTDTDTAAVYVSGGRYGSTSAGGRVKTPGWVLVSPLEPAQPVRQFRTLDGAVDMDVQGSTLWVLTYTAIEEWHLPSGERKGVYPTTLDGRPLTANLTQALGFSRDGDELVIAHGRSGLSIFDTVTRQVVHEEELLVSQSPLESTVKDVAVKDGVAIFVLDNFTLAGSGEKPAFHGAVAYDVKARKVLRELEILDPGVESITVSGDEAFVSWGTPIWVFSWESLLNDRNPKPLRRVWDFKATGYPKGKPSMSGDAMLTCFLTFSPSGSGLGRLSPKALDRRALGL